jgi:hypothetical protein
VPVVTAVKEAIRALKMSESDIQGAIVEVSGADFEIKGVPNMPAYLRRFLAELASQPGFSYEVSQDEERGWVVPAGESTPIEGPCAVSDSSTSGRTPGSRTRRPD